jgi:plastocyanin
MRLLPLLLVVALAGCGESAASATKPKPVTVDIASFKYKPETVTVKAGGKVTWVNQDKAGHTATFTGGLDTDRLEKGERKALTFDKPGRYPYVCAFHAFMTGVVVVK